MLVSVLKLYSYGQVVEANDDQKRTINVKILEHTPSRYGTVSPDVDTDTVDVDTFNVPVSTDDNGNQSFEQQTRTVSCTFKDYVPATWLNRNSQRITPPKVVPGQRVLLWRVGDSRQYYWEELDVDNRLKPDEHILIAINNNNKGEPLGFDNAYIIELSTRDKRIRIKTNRNNGEKSAFEVDINGMEGFLKLTDDCITDGESYDGNGLLIDSVNTYVKMKNINDSHYILDKDDIFMFCKGNRTSKIGGLDHVEAGNVLVETNDHTTICNTYLEKASKITMSAPSIVAGGGSMSISAALSVGPPAGVAGTVGIWAAEGVIIDGTTRFIQPVSFTSTITANGSAAFNSPVTFAAGVSGTTSVWSAGCDYPGKN